MTTKTKAKTTSKTKPKTKSKIKSQDKGKNKSQPNRETLALLVTQGVAVRRLRTVWRVERFAEFAAVHFRFCADQRFDILWIIVPALQMAAAELSLGIFFIAGALRGFLWLNFWYLGSCWLGYGRGGACCGGAGRGGPWSCRSGGSWCSLRRSDWRGWLCRSFWSGFVWHSKVPSFED